MGCEKKGAYREWFESPHHMAEFVKSGKLKAALEEMLEPSDLPFPTAVMTDKGIFAWHGPVPSKIAEQWREALFQEGFSPFEGTTTWQPGAAADLMLHENLIGMIKRKMSITQIYPQPARTVEQYRKALDDAIDHANSHYNLSKLCKSLHSRAQKVVAKNGGRLRN